jgi:DNA polymerase-3 subunit alpha
VPELIEPDRIVLVTGRIDLRGRELQIRATQIKEPQLGTGDHQPIQEALVVDLTASACTPTVLHKLKALFEASPGREPVKLRFVSSEGTMPLDLGDVTVSTHGSLLDELRALLGPRAARLEPS